MYYMCIYTCTYKEREGGEGERDTTSTCSCIHCIECITAAGEDCGDFDFINYFSNYYNCFY